MGNFKYHVSLRIDHPSMDPEHICTGLGLNAEYKWKAGAERKTPTGQSLPGTYEATYCCFELMHAKRAGLTDFLKMNTRKLYKHREFLDSIRSTGGTLEYFIGWFADTDSGEIFDLELLNQFVELGINISIAVYPNNKREGRENGKPE